MSIGEYHYEPQFQGTANPVQDQGAQIAQNQNPIKSPTAQTDSFQPKNINVKTGGSKVIPITLAAIALFVIYIAIKGSWQNVLGMFNFQNLGNFLNNSTSYQTGGITSGPTKGAKILTKTPGIVCDVGGIPVLTAVGWACKAQSAK